MRNAPVRPLSWIILSLSLNLVGCSNPTPAPPTEPLVHRPMMPEGIMPAPAMAPQAPLQAPAGNGNGAMAIPFPSTQTPSTMAPGLTLPQAPGPIQPMQSPVSFDQMQAQLPGQIPAQSAAGQLFPLNSAQLANVQYPLTPFGGTAGYSYGAVPNMMNYGIYNNCLYYPYQGVMVPYTLQGDCYYPYVYAYGADPTWSGYCVYPFLYWTNGLYYPYFYYSNNYLYGFPDWEYNWPVYRSRHRNYDWDRLNTHRRVGTRDFNNWRERGPRGNRRDAESPRAQDRPRGRRFEPQESPAAESPRAQDQPRGRRFEPQESPAAESPQARPPMRPQSQAASSSSDVFRGRGERQRARARHDDAED